ncbi:hypothetical protein PpBr36_07912 [Pyricularia pennisetigena]|uniref:hypothetical protein n=1 Tax=Pyricularia pennisetigena TaxID=1578925 RepID=UPI0011519D5E|nr:hypothetical protein PpBr36_07912 [Pyricularia pennisetigena]TLS25208.1 hypothetical protein PpBr36_07912 [Pyricularia pennisetigena]
MAFLSHREQGKQTGEERDPMLKAKAEMRIQTLHCSSVENKHGLRDALAAAPEPTLYNLCSQRLWFSWPKPSLHLMRHINP